MFFSLALWQRYWSWGVPLPFGRRDRHKLPQGLPSLRHRPDRLPYPSTPRSAVHWTLESSVHTVHGAFRAKRGSVTFDSATGKASGEIVVDRASGESGNDTRDHKMHNEVMESSGYPEVVFRPEPVEAKVNPVGSSTPTVYGTFSLYGAVHAFSAPVQLELHDTGWKASTSFGAPFLEWGPKNPSNFLLKVRPVVSVSVELSGSLQRSARQP